MVQILRKKETPLSVSPKGREEIRIFLAFSECRKDGSNQKSESKSCQNATDENEH
jgi:hypothetical protein